MTITFTELYQGTHQYSAGTVEINQPFSGNTLSVELTTKPEYAATKQVIGYLFQFYGTAQKSYALYSGKDVVRLELPESDKLWFSPTQYLSDSYTLTIGYTDVGTIIANSSGVAIPEQILGLPARVTTLESDVAEHQTYIENVSTIIDALESSDTSQNSRLTTLEGMTSTPSWESITGKPTSFAPSTHAHEITDVMGLTTALAGKADSAHSHAISSVTGLSSQLSTFGSDITDLDSRVTTLETSGVSTSTFPQKVKLNGTGDRGLFWYLGTLGTDESFIDPITRGSITGLLSSQLSAGTGVINAINRAYANPLHSLNEVGAWLGFDLGSNRSLLIDRYRLRSRTDFNGNHLTSWVLEGTNSVSANTVAGFNAATWESIDTQNGFTGLTGQGLSASFVAIKDSYYRYIRLRQTGTDSSGTNYLTLSAIEFFGVLNLTS